MAKFQTGGLYMTRGVSDKTAASAAFANFVNRSLSRYLAGDWGEMDAGDKHLNDVAIADPDGGRVFAAYKNDQWKIWIITEADRSTTTVLFPSEY
jgi:hypothetical protein